MEGEGGSEGGKPNGRFPDPFAVGLAYGFARVLEQTSRFIRQELDRDPSEIDRERIEHLLSDAQVELDMVREELGDAFGGGSG